MAVMKWTVVQHSAYGYNGDPTFKKGLETRVVSNSRELALVERAGGLVFDSYGKADEFAMSAMYTGESMGLVPHAKGTFSDKEIDGLRIYIPVRQVTG